MSDLNDLYQQVILDHNRNPRNYGSIENADGEADGHNPLCGDKVRVYVALDGDTIRSARFEGSGCAISTASASLMTEAVIGKTLAEAAELFDGFQELVTSPLSSETDALEAAESLGKLAVLTGVRAFPMRVKCATLAWHTFRAALEKETATVTTE